MRGEVERTWQRALDAFRITLAQVTQRRAHGPEARALGQALVRWVVDELTKGGAGAEDLQRLVEIGRAHV